LREKTTMARSIWSGSISFGLVTVPIRMFSAVTEHDLHFHYVHAPDSSRIGYEKICKSEGKPVPDDEIVKAFEWEKGEYVYLSDEDFEAAKVDGLRTMDIDAFVDYDAIDPIYFERTYYLEPQEGGEKVYALLARALEESRLAGVVRFVMRDRQHLGCLRVRDGVITLERMHFSDEIKPLDGIAPGNVKVDKRELDLAKELIDRFRGEFEPESYEDTYRDTLCEIIKAKRSGEEVHVEPTEEEPEEPADLMEALRASIEASSRAKKDGRSSRPARRPARGRQGRKQGARRK
jgi:DNA end-binding protein Ku